MRKEPFSMLIISGKMDTALLVEQMQLYEAERFHIQMTIQEDNDPEILDALMKMNDVILLYGVSLETKSRLLYRAIALKKVLYVTPDAYVSLLKNSRVEMVAGMPFLKVQRLGRHTYFGKWLLNTLVALFISILTIPVVIGIMVAMAVEDGGEFFIPFYSLTSVRNGVKPFKRIWFRICRRNSAVNYQSYQINPDELLESNELTKVGRWLVKTRAYMLPDLYQVIAGRLYLVGPQGAVGKNREDIAYETLSQQVDCGNQHLTFSLGKPGMMGYSQLFTQETASEESIQNWNLCYLYAESIWTDLRVIWLSLGGKGKHSIRREHFSVHQQQPYVEKFM